MPVEGQETAVKEVAESAPVTPSPEAVKPPAESNTAQPKTESTVPYERFKEVNEKSKTYERELTELRGKLANREVKEVKEPETKPGASYSQRLVEKGFEPKVAEALAEAMESIAKDKAASYDADKNLAVEAKRVAVEKSDKEIALWKSEFKKSHADLDEYEPLMQKEWEALDENAKLMLVSSPKSYEALYKMAKGGKLDEAHQKGVEEGRQSAYESKSLKGALSSIPGATATPGKKFTAADLKGMTDAFYIANKDQILRDLNQK